MHFQSSVLHSPFTPTDETKFPGKTSNSSWKTKAFEKEERSGRTWRCTDNVQLLIQHFLRCTVIFTSSNWFSKKDKHPSLGFSTCKGSESWTCSTTSWFKCFCSIGLWKQRNECQAWTAVQTGKFYLQVVTFSTYQLLNDRTFQGLSAHMKLFINNLDMIQDAYLTQNHASGAGKDCNICGQKEPAIYRCNDCWLMGPSCLQCLLKAHKFRPWDKIERFNGQFFEADSLQNLGAVFSINHPGSRCPN